MASFETQNEGQISKINVKSIHVELALLRMSASELASAFESKIWVQFEDQIFGEEEHSINEAVALRRLWLGRDWVESQLVEPFIISSEIQKSKVRAKC